MLDVIYRHKWFSFILLVTALILIFLPEIFFVTYGSILVAIFLYTCATFIHEKVKIPFTPSLFISVILVFLFFTILGLSIYPSFDRELGEFFEALPATLNKNLNSLQSTSWGKHLSEQIKDAENQSKFLSSDLVPKTANLLISFFTGIGTLGIVMVIGFYSTLNARKYIHFLTVVSDEEKLTIMQKIYHNTQKWLFGKFLGMLAIGIFTYIGLTILGVKAAFALAIIAGLLNFIPNIGPILSFVPAAFMAMADSYELALYTAGLFMLVQMLEGIILTPIIDKKTVSLLPSITILFQLLMAAIFGFAGLFFASPILIIIATIFRYKLPKKAFGPPEEK